VAKFDIYVRRASGFTIEADNEDHAIDIVYQLSQSDSTFIDKHESSFEVEAIEQTN
jgi:hypothetical protein